MPLLPTVMPPHFNNTYTSIAAAGTEGQLGVVVPWLTHHTWDLSSPRSATQLTNAGLVPGVAQVQAWLLSHWWSLQVEERRRSVSGKPEEEEEVEEHRYLEKLHTD